MTVEHDIANHRFVVHLPEGDGELVYAIAGPQVLELQHTGVDPALRGHGVADHLAVAAFEYARRNGEKVIPTCPFIRTWLKRHPEQADIVTAR